VGDVTNAFWAIEAMEEEFAVDGLSVREQALAEAGKVIRTPEDGMEIVEQALKLITSALDEDNFEIAGKLGQVAEDAAKQTKNLPLVLSVQRERQGIEKAQKQFAALKMFVDRLKQDPTDAEANLQNAHYLPANLNEKLEKISYKHQRFERKWLNLSCMQYILVFLP
jgi:hypothetical protein